MNATLTFWKKFWLQATQTSKKLETQLRALCLLSWCYSHECFKSEGWKR